MQTVIDRLIRYVKINSQSDPHSNTHPSSEILWNIARLLRDELHELGLAEVELDEFGIVTATLPANGLESAPVIGWIAHYDTSPDMSDQDVKPQFVTNYDGEDIILNKDLNIVLSPRDFPELRKYIGKTLITTDGTTLLGADDKAGVAEIMTAVETLLNHPEIKHGKIRIAFTPDEEVGHGVDNFDVQKFGASFAYTVDGDELGALQFENFNAAGARVVIHGRNVHPGSAKNKMLNAILIGSEFNDLLPVQQRPEFTSAYEGFFHIMAFNGTVEEAALAYIIRDHNRAKFEAKKAQIQQAADFINAKYGAGVVTLEVKDQYANMRELIEPVYHIIDLAERAMRAVQVTPLITPVRGGTDGAWLSYRGLPTPNLFTGGHNYHGKYEYIPTFAMEKAVEVLVKIAELAGQ
jgi:tripeptide aminopeptidase